MSDDNYDPYSSPDPVGQYGPPSTQGQYGGYGGYGDYGGYGQQQPQQKIDLGPIKEQVEKYLPLLKKNAPTIVGVIVILIVGLFIYDFFIGSMREVAISVENTEGETINNASIKIYTEQDPKAIEQFTGSQLVNLRKGDYLLDIIAPGYKTQRGEFVTIGDYAEGQTTIDQTIEVVKDFTIDLSLSFPGSLVAGEKATIPITLSNKTEEYAEVELSFGKDLKDKIFDIKYSPEPIPVPADGEVKVNLILQVKEDAEEYGNKSGSIGIKYTNKKESFDFELLEFDSSDVRVNTTSVNFGKVKAGETKEKDFKITNKNKDFTMKNIQFSIEELITKNNDSVKVMNWFRFSPKTIEELESGTSAAEKIDISVDVPLSAKEDNIDGRVVLSTSYWSEGLDLDLEIVPANIELEVDGIDSDYTILKDMESGKYDSESETLVLRNRGDIDIDDITIALDTAGGCNEEWVTITGQKEYNTIETGESKNSTRINITAPDRIDPGAYQICNIIVRFTNPADPLQREKITKSFEIKTQ